MDSTPDRVITDEETRLWRLTAVVYRLRPHDALTDYRFQNPVPVRSGGRLVGSAALELRGRSVYAQLFLDYSIPERLDAEAGQRVWALPVAESRGFLRATGDGGSEIFPGVRDIVELQLRHDCDDPDLPSLGEAVL